MKSHAQLVLALKIEKEVYSMLMHASKIKTFDENFIYMSWCFGIVRKKNLVVAWDPRVLSLSPVGR